MHFITNLPISINSKGNNYNFIPVIIDWLIKMIQQMPVKITINIPKLAKVIINIRVWHYNLNNFIVINKDLVFTLKFWLLLCYFLGITQQLAATFYLQTNCQIKRQSSIIKTYVKVFVNFEQNNWARLLLIAKYSCNNV